MTTEFKNERMSQPVDPRHDLFKNVVKGRGLWIGLFPSHAIHHDSSSWLPKDAHSTLAHLGKGHMDETAAKHAVSIVHEVMRWYRERWNTDPIPGSITGAGWFWRKREPTWIALV